MKESASVSRRSVLRSCVSAAAGAGVLGAASGTGAAADTTADVAVMLTSKCYSDHADPTTKRSDVRKFCGEVWRNNVSRDVAFHSIGAHSIPEDALNDTSNLMADRVIGMDYWLRNEWDRYEEMDAILVLDYFENDGNPGNAYEPGSAGTGEGHTVGVNVWQEDNGALPFDDSPSNSIEGVAFHELGHCWGATHQDATVNDFHRASLMYQHVGDHEPTCNAATRDKSEVEGYAKFLSQCTIDTIERHFDDVLSPVEPVVGDAVPTDPDGDGLYEDVNGNGDPDFGDVIALNDNIGEPAVEDHVEFYDFNRNGEVDYGDVTSLFDQL